MDILYLSPSLLPSRSANSIHVVRMCEAFAHLGHSVTLVGNRSLQKKCGLKAKLEKFYGVNLGGVELVTVYAKFNTAITFRLGVFSFLYLLKERFLQKPPDVIVSRNLYGSYFLLSSKRIPHIFETHQLEYGFRQHFQRALVMNEKIHTVVISQALQILLAQHHKCNDFNALVLPDAAPFGIERQSPDQKRRARREILGPTQAYEYKPFIGYFGHLYAGRGIELIKSLAARHSDMLFLIFGGNKEEIEVLSRENLTGNFRLMGFIEPSLVAKTIGAMDVLLMPYQDRVSIGSRETDTARWMSPLKLFEYMASGVPIISSLLPSLSEVLKHEHNALMVRSNDIEQWSASLNRLTNDMEFAERLASTAYSEYVGKYSWTIRAARMLDKGISRT